MDFSSLPKYPMPTRIRPEDARGDIDWRLLLSRLFLYGIIVLFIGLMLFAILIVVTLGQVLRLLEMFA